MGFEPKKIFPPDLIVQERAKFVTVNEFIERIKNLEKYLRSKIFIIQAIYKTAVNARRRFYSRYLVGNLVWLNTRNLQITQFFIKLDDHNIKPYRIFKIYKKKFLIVKFDLSVIIDIHPVFHINLFQSAVDDPLPGQREKSRKSVIAHDGQRE